MSDFALGFLKDCWLGLLYLFVLRVVWVVGRELKGSPALVSAAGDAGPLAPAISKPKPRKTAAHKSWQLVIKKPAELRETVVAVAQEITIGRGGGCAIALANDTFVSTVHARVVPRGDTVWLEDLGSTNGTLLNTQRVSELTQLKDGDRIEIGSSLIEVTNGVLP